MDPALLEQMKEVEKKFEASAQALRAELEKKADERNADAAQKHENEMKAMREELKALKEADARRHHVPGLTPDAPEAKNFNLAAAIGAASDGDWRKAGPEREILKSWRETDGARESWARLYDKVPLHHSDVRKDMNSSDDPRGGFLVPPAVMAARFVDKLRARSAILRLGAQLFPDASGYDPIEIPKLVSSTTATHTAETGTVSPQNAEIGQIEMRPHLITSAIEFSMRLAKNSPIGISQLLETMLSKDIGETWDRGCISGGANAYEPTGILNQPGIGTSAFGSVTLADATAYDKLVAMLGVLGEANAIEFGSDAPEKQPCKWLLPVTTGWVKLAQQKDPTDNTQPKARRLFSEGPFRALLGLPYVASTHCPASNLVLADWSLYALVTWGGLAIYVDRLTVNGKLKNQILGAMEYDGIPLQPSAFVKATGIS